MANRADRRKHQKQRSGYMRKTLEERKAAIFRNGITTEHLDKEYAAGYKRGEIHTMQMVYAALMLAANDEFGFGARRVLKLLKTTDRKVLETLTSEELINEVFARFKIQLDFDAPLERVKEGERMS